MSDWTNDGIEWKKVSLEKTIETMFVVLAIILIVDQLWLFGIPFGPILPNLSWMDPTQPYTTELHHWMIGATVLVFIFIRRLDRGKK